jgi:hypothetical protein
VNWGGLAAALFSVSSVIAFLAILIPRRATRIDRLMALGESLCGPFANLQITRSPNQSEI